MSEYRRVLERLAQGRISERMPCSSPEQIEAWFDVALRHARDEFRIYANDLNWHIFQSPSVLSAAEQFLTRRGARLQVLLRVAPLVNADRQWLRRFDRSSGAVEFRSARGNYARPDTQLFAVVDDSGYRFEGDRIKFANFNEPSEAGRLLRAFDGAFALGQTWFLHPHQFEAQAATA